MGTAAVYAEIVKHERTPDGDLLVYGRATGPDLDLDRQVCDPAWLAKAMPEWFATGANVREQHSSIAAGVGQEIVEKGDGGWDLRALVVDPNSARKVERGVLKGYSIGIRNPQVIKDASAPGGRITGGSIVEVSLVDRPANPTCQLTLAKTAKPGMTVKPGEFDSDRMLVKVEELTERPLVDRDALGAAIEKRDFDATQREQAAKTGAAMPDGSFPIKTVADLKNAIQAIGRAKDPEAVRAHIRARAKALGRPELVPASWSSKAAEPGMWVHDPAEIAQVRDGLVRLIGAELDELSGGENELCDIQGLMSALCQLMCWWKHEAAEGETSDPYPRGDATEGGPMAVTIGLAAEATDDKTAVEKAAPAEETAVNAAEPAEKTPDLTELVEAAVAKAVAPIQAQLAKAMEQPAPGGPVLTRTTEDATKAAKRENALSTAAHYERLANELRADPATRAGYLQKAAELRATS